MVQGLLQQVGPLQQQHPCLAPATGCVELPQLLHQGVALAGDQRVLVAIVRQWPGAVHAHGSHVHRSW